MEDSDDDDLLPSAQKMIDLFRNMDREVRRPTVQLPTKKESGPSPGKAEEGENVKSKLKKSRRRKHRDGSKDPAAGCSVEQEAYKALDETEILLAQAASLLEPDVPISSLSQSKYSDRNGRKVTQTPPEVSSSEKKRRGRPRKVMRLNEPLPIPVLPLPVEVVDISDDDMGDMLTQEVIEPPEREPTPPKHVPVPEYALDDSFNGYDDLMTLEPENHNKMCTIRVRWKDEILRFEVPSSSKLSQVRMEISEKVSLRADNLVIINESNLEKLSDHVVVDEIPFGDVLEVLHVEEESLAKKFDNDDSNFIKLKVQGCGGHRQRYNIQIQRTTHIQQLMDDYIEKYGLQGKKFKLVFDGDTVDLKETAESLDLEGGEIFDIVEV